jgi:hypothetical protein
VQQEIVDLVGEDQLLHFDLLLAQRVGQHHGLAELYVAVVVPLDQQHRRASASDISQRRRFERHSIVGLGRGDAELSDPIVHAVEIDAGAEEIGSASHLEPMGLQMRLLDQREDAMLFVARRPD